MGIVMRMVLTGVDHLGVEALEDLDHWQCLVSVSTPEAIWILELKQVPEACVMSLVMIASSKVKSRCQVV